MLVIQLGAICFKATSNTIKLTYLAQKNEYLVYIDYLAPFQFIKLSFSMNIFQRKIGLILSKEKYDLVRMFLSRTFIGVKMRSAGISAAIQIQFDFKTVRVMVLVGLITNNSNTSACT